MGKGREGPCGFGRRGVMPSVRVQRVRVHSSFPRAGLSFWRVAFTRQRSISLRLRAA